jgi:hypothetical protein
MLVPGLMLQKELVDLRASHYLIISKIEPSGYEPEGVSVFVLNRTITIGGRSTPLIR